MQKLLIEKADNGFILTHTTEFGEEVTKSVSVIEEKLFFGGRDESQADCDLYEKLIWGVLEAFGHYGSKHNQYRLTTKVVKQFNDDGTETEEEELAECKDLK